MDYQKIKQQIVLLEKKIKDLDGKPSLNEAEEDLREEMLSTVTELRNSLPSQARTMQNRRISSGNNGGFKNLGEQLLAVRNASIAGNQVDPRLYNVATGTGEVVPSDGGFLVGQDFSNELLANVFSTGQVAKLCRRIPISSNSNGLKMNGIDETSRVSGSRQGGILSYWSEEAGTLTASKPKFRQINLELKKLIGLCYASDELLQDAAALNAVIESAFVSEFGFALDDGIINGTGAGQPLGILNAGCLVTVAKESGQKAATLIAENVINIYSRLLPSATNPVWLVNKNVIPQLFTMSLAVGTGGIPLFMPAGGVSGLPYQTLFGLPIIVIEQASALGTVGDIILGDFSNGYLIAEKGGISSDMSIHVRFLNDENVFRFVLRIDGQPVIAAPLTPYKGTATLSYFVTLAAR